MGPEVRKACLCDLAPTTIHLQDTDPTGLDQGVGAQIQLAPTKRAYPISMGIMTNKIPNFNLKPYTKPHHQTVDLGFFFG